MQMGLRAILDAHPLTAPNGPLEHELQRGFLTLFFSLWIPNPANHGLVPESDFTDLTELISLWEGDAG